MKNELIKILRHFNQKIIILRDTSPFELIPEITNLKDLLVLCGIRFNFVA